MVKVMELQIQAYKGSDAYRLLDTGNKLKLEKIGGILVIRSEPRAWWKRRLPKTEWEKAQAVYDTEDAKEWILKEKIPREFTVFLEQLTIKLKFVKSSKHIGIFPEQTDQWKFIRERLQGREGMSVLNIFGYTGIASLISAQSGAKVTHVDGSKTALAWARENQELSGLQELPIRWILDDALDFIKREVKRGNRYDGIIMDPPSFGRGPKGQVWKVEEDLPQLLTLCKELFTETPLFLIINMYSTELSSISLGNLVSETVDGLKGSLECGELGIKEDGGGRVLSLSIFSRWKAI